MKVSVAIPSFNGKSYLEKLLPSLSQQGFDRILVIDDASTDGSREWLRGLSNITVIQGNKNLGPTGNRNRILGHVKEGVILFLDADMQFLSNDVAEKIRQHFVNKLDLAVLGAQINSSTNEPMWYNWGYESSPKRDGITSALNSIALAHWGDETIMAAMREAARNEVGHFEPVKDRKVDWVVEQFFAVRADIFQQLEGFDPQFKRFHEGPDYCKRAKNLGFTTQFCTDIKLKHLDMHTGEDAERAKALRDSTAYWYKKHYGVPAEIIEQFFLW